MSPEAQQRAQQLALRRARPRSPFLRGSAVAAVAGVAASWAAVGADAASLVQPRARANLTRFLGELRPHGTDDWSGWAWALLVEHGAEALAATLALSLAAMGLAAVVAAPASLLAAGNLATARPFQDPPSGAWRGLRAVTRGGMALSRALPEYLVAFLLILLLGPGAWPAVLALALHNAGILSKLWAEVLEDAEPSAGHALWRGGAGRGQAAALALLPAVAGRLTLYLFARWETAVREATVLGMLGFVSLGWFVQDARARLHYDELAFYVGLGAALVLIGDLIGVAARRALR